MLVRAKDPASGKLDFPGGFVDPGEGALEGLKRECREELGWEPDGDFSLFASFPNIYSYRGISYNTCDLFFTTQAPKLRIEDLKLDKEENLEARFVDPRLVHPDDLAFDSTKKAIEAYITKYYEAP